MRIGIDLMGNDCSPIDLFKALEQAFYSYPSCNFCVFATKAVQELLLNHYLFLIEASSICFKIASDAIEMHDEPLLAFKNKKNSSLILGLDSLKKGEIDALICAGNTGALITAATMILPLLPSIKRIALCVLLPTKKGQVAVVDVGGNINFKADSLVQFAHLGAFYQHCRHEISLSKVGLLNIGIESTKGTQEMQKAYQMLNLTLPHIFQFIGNIEGRDVFEGKVDVLVTDGFTGNVFLKAVEGLSEFILNKINVGFKDYSDAHKATLQFITKELEIDSHAGAIVLGLEHLIIKCHGQTSNHSLFNAIGEAIALIEKKLMEKLKHHFSH